MRSVYAHNAVRISKLGLKIGHDQYKPGMETKKTKGTWGGSRPGPRNRPKLKEPTKVVRIPVSNILNRYKFKDRDGRNYEVLDKNIEGAEGQVYSNHKAEGLRLLTVTKL